MNSNIPSPIIFQFPKNRLCLVEIGSQTAAKANQASRVPKPYSTANFNLKYVLFFRMNALNLLVSSRGFGLAGEGQTPFRTEPRPRRSARCTKSKSLFATIALLLAGCPAVSQIDPQQRAAETIFTDSELSAPANVDSTIKRIDAVLKDNLDNRLLSTDVQAAWQILHGVLAYGPDLRIKTSAGEVVAIDYLLQGGQISGFVLHSGDRFESGSDSNDLTLTRGIRSELDPGEKHGQGHRDQWLAYMTSCNLPVDQVIQTLDGPRRVEMWLRQIEWDVPLNFEREFSWTLMSLVPYRKSSHRWEARDGNQYSIETLLQSELDRLSPDSACGGSHRLTAIARTLQKRRDEGQVISGVWADADALLANAIDTALDFQNADGTFSSNYFERAGWSLDLSTQIGTTGHTLEFIAAAASQDRLTDPRVQVAANKLCELLEQTKDIDLECGALYHALSGLRLYRDRLSSITASS